MGQKPGEAIALIRILKSKTREELEEYEIEDRTKTILEVRRVLTKINLMCQGDNKCHNLEGDIKKFHKKFNKLHQKGLLGLNGMGDKLVNLENYQQKLYSIAGDQSKFSSIKGIITRKAFMEGLSFDLLIKHEIKHLFIVKPTF